MAASARHTLLRAAVAVAIASAVAGCATRYDVNGNLIYRWQFGQDTSRAIDYSNPRLPQLPANRPSTDLWPVPSPYQFKDLSQYSQLAPLAPLPATDIRVGDNAACAASFCEPTAPVALLASRADARDGRRTSAAR
jgi:hypothetical protein